MKLSYGYLATIGIAMVIKRADNLGKNVKKNDGSSRRTSAVVRGSPQSRGSARSSTSSAVSSTGVSYEMLPALAPAPDSLGSLIPADPSNSDVASDRMVDSGEPYATNNTERPIPSVVTIDETKKKMAMKIYQSKSDQLTALSDDDIDSDGSAGELLKNPPLESYDSISALTQPDMTPPPSKVSLQLGAAAHGVKTTGKVVANGLKTGAEYTGAQAKKIAQTGAEYTSKQASKLIKSGAEYVEKTGTTQLQEVGGKAWESLKNSASYVEQTARQHGAPHFQAVKQRIVGTGTVLKAQSTLTPK